MQMVSSQSASLLGKRMMFLDADHSGLNKFGGEDDDNFKLVLPEIRRMVEDGPSIVAERYRLKGKNTKYVFRLALANVFTVDATSTPHSNVHYKVPRAVNRLFTGRAELLTRIIKTLRGDGPFHTSRQKRFVITGLGGQGKSEICLQVADLIKDEYITSRTY